MSSAGLVEQADVEYRDTLLIELFDMQQRERNDIKQKGRIKWAVEGDENTRFFHTTVKKKLAKHMIKGINRNGEWCDTPEIIKAAAFDHFHGRFK